MGHGSVNRCHSGCLIVAAIALGGCGNGSDMRFRLESGDDLEEVAGLEIQLRDGSRVRTLTIADYTDRSTSRPKTPRFSVSDSGELVIAITWRVGEEVVASGEAMIVLRDQFDWLVDIERSVDDPLQTCLGNCLGSEGLPIEPASQRTPGEAFWVQWSGREKGSNTIFD